MGVALLAEHVDRLLAAGADPDTAGRRSCENATLPAQRVTRAPSRRHRRRRGRGAASRRPRSSSSARCAAAGAAWRRAGDRHRSGQVMAGCVVLVTADRRSAELAVGPRPGAGPPCATRRPSASCRTTHDEQLLARHAGPARRARRTSWWSPPASASAAGSRPPTRPAWPTTLLAVLGAAPGSSPAGPRRAARSRPRASRPTGWPSPRRRRRSWRCCSARASPGSASPSSTTARAPTASTPSWRPAGAEVRQPGGLPLGPAARPRRRCGRRCWRRRPARSTPSSSRRRPGPQAWLQAVEDGGVSRRGRWPVSRRPHGRGRRRTR